MNKPCEMCLRMLGAVVLFGVALFCCYGFLASSELGFPNVFHVIYAAVGFVALGAVGWLIQPAFAWLKKACDI